MSNALTYENLLEMYKQVNIKKEDLYKFKVNEELTIDIRNYRLSNVGRMYTLVHIKDPFDTISLTDPLRFENAHFIFLDGLTKELADELTRRFPILLEPLPRYDKVSLK